MNSITFTFTRSLLKIVQVMIYDKNEIFKKNIYILYVVRLEPTISTFTAMPSIQMAKRDSDGYMSRKNLCLKSILFIMFANLKLV